MRYDNYILLITGCASPNPNVPHLKVKERSEREKQYYESIKYYITSTPIKNIIYCDNSLAQKNYEIARLAKTNNKEFEWLAFKGNQKKVIEQGKGYGEGEIIYYAITHSRIIKEDSYLIKVTGRLIVKNLSFILKFTNPRQIYFHPIKTLDGRIYINTRLYMMPVVTYRSYFVDAYQQVDDRNLFFLEHAFGSTVKDNSIKFHCFITAPIYEGISGSTGNVYQYNLKEHLKDTVKMYLEKWKMK